MAQLYRNRSRGGKSTREHTLVAERALGRPLPANAVVHHVNEIKTDNRPENLVICPDRAYHNLLHRRARAFDECGHADWLKCCYCGMYDAPQNMRIYVAAGENPRGRHAACEFSRGRKRFDNTRKLAYTPRLASRAV